MGTKMLTENEHTSDTELLLAHLAMQLHSFHNYLFYKMLKFMQSSERDEDVQSLAAEILLQVKRFDPVMSCGTYV